MPGLAKCPLPGKKYVDIGFDIPIMLMIRNYVIDRIKIKAKPAKILIFPFLHLDHLNTDQLPFPMKPPVMFY